MRTTIRSTPMLAIVLAAVPVAFPAVAQERKMADEPKVPHLFYEGSLEVRSVRGVIDLESSATPRLSVALGGLREGSASVSIGGGEPARIEPTERDQVVELAPKLLRSGKAGGAQEVALDLRLLVDGAPIARPIDGVQLEVLLPRGVPALIRSNQPVERVAASDGRVAYRLTKTRYLSSWRVVYSVGPVTLEIEKRLEPASITRADQPVTVTLRVRNLGRSEARGVELADDFDPRDFAAEGAAFQVLKGEPNDRRLLWRGSIDRLASGAETTVQYALRSRQAVHSVSLPGARATIGAELVGVSNKVILAPAK